MRTLITVIQKKISTAIQYILEKNIILSQNLTDYFRQTSLNEKIDNPYIVKDSDLFDVKNRYVKPIYQHITKNKKNKFLPPTIITGDMGAGKTVILNFLKEEIRSNEPDAIIIDLIPTVERNYAACDLIESLLSKISFSLDKRLRKKFQTITKRLLLSLKIMIPSQVSLGIVSYDLDHKFKETSKIWSNEKDQGYLYQLQQLNQLIKSACLKIYVTSDDVDRPKAGDIINFLLFCRIMQFLDATFIIALDYNQVLNKLMREGQIGEQVLYDSATDYLNTFIGKQFHVSHFSDRSLLLNYVNECCKRYTSKEFYEFFVKAIGENSPQFAILNDIIYFLENPRNIKNWIIEIGSYYKFLQKVNSFPEWLAFIACYVKHPSTLTNITKNTTKYFLCNELQSEVLLKQLWSHISQNSRQIGHDKYDEKFILIISMGLICKKTNALDEVHQDIYNRAYKYLSILNPIDDDTACDFLINFWDKTSDEDKYKFFSNNFYNELSINYEFFHGDVDEAIIQLLDHEQAELIVGDIVNQMESKKARIKIPNIFTISKLWSVKIKRSENLPFNIHGKLLLCLIVFYRVDEIVNNTPYSLSHLYLNLILGEFSIHNKNGEYLLKGFTSPASLKHFSNVSLNARKKLIDASLDDIKDILSSWVVRIEATLVAAPLEIFTDPDVFNFLYRYVQWSYSIGGIKKAETCPKKLNYSLMNFFQNAAVTEDQHKEFLISLLNTLLAHQQPIVGEANAKYNPLLLLFNRDEEVITLLIKKSTQFGMQKLTNLLTEKIIS